MKKIIIILFLLSALGGLKSAQAQFILEHIYDNTSANLYMVKLDIEGMKYVKRDYNNLVIELYNLDHSLFKTIPLPSDTNASYLYTLYISEHLFNCDDDSIDLMFGFVRSNNWRFWIINESGNVLFYADSLTPVVTVNAPQEQLPIYNTPNGTKMILSNPRSNTTRVYDICGTLTENIKPLGVGNVDGLSIFPNPSHENTTIDFTLPKGVNTADIVLYNLNGEEIKRYKVDNTFNNLILNNSDLKAGTYLYELVTANGGFGAKRMVVIK
jgi:hypothetical protein